MTKLKIIKKKKQNYKKTQNLLLIIQKCQIIKMKIITNNRIKWKIKQWLYKIKINVNNKILIQLKIFNKIIYKLCNNKMKIYKTK